MATRKDLLDAEAHTRRRVAAAFISGTAGVAEKPEVEPPRPGRTVVAGIALALLLLAGAAVAGVLRTSDDVDRSASTLVVERGSATLDADLPAADLPPADRRGRPVGR